MIRFVCRGLDALNYACYQMRALWLSALHRVLRWRLKAGQYQFISTPLIGMSQDGLAGV